MWINQMHESTIHEDLCGTSILNIIISSKNAPLLVGLFTTNGFPNFVPLKDPILFLSKAQWRHGEFLDKV